jgi:hypothetical protein
VNQEASGKQASWAKKPGELTLEELSGILWGLCYLEECLFHLAGSWAAREQQPSAVIAFHLESRRHGLWALSFGNLVPRASGFPEGVSDIEVLAQSLLDVLEQEPRDSSATSFRVAALFFGWLPALSGLVATLAEELSPFSSGALVQALELWLVQQQRWEKFLELQLATGGILEPEELAGPEGGSQEELVALGSSLASPLRQALVSLAGSLAESLAKRWTSLDQLVQVDLQSGQDSQGDRGS